MINYVIINGVNSNTKTGLMINELPPITKPSMRTDTEEIDGRDGDIITKLGYSAYDKTITIGLWGATYDVNDIISFFTSEGTITFSNEPDKFYKFTMVNEINVESLLRFKTASITFHCQPFKYPTEETPLEIEYEYLEQTDVESANITPTEEAPMHLSLKGNTSQTGTPTPSTPIDVNVVSGDNEVVVCGKNLIETSSTAFMYHGTYESGANTNEYKLTATGNDMYVNEIASTGTSYQAKNGTLMSCNYGETIYFNIGNSSFYTNYFTEFDKDLKSLGYHLKGQASGSYTPTNANCKYVTLRFGYSSSASGTTYTLAPIVVKGTNETTYEPYQSQTYEVDLPVGLELCKKGTYQDYFTKNSGKNLLNLVNFTTTTLNGVTFTKNSNGSITLNGTATAEITLDTPISINLTSGTSYIISQGTIYSGANYAISMRNQDYSVVTDTSIDSSLTSKQFTFSSTIQPYYFRIYVVNGKSFNNHTIFPMVRLASITDDTYEPYGTGQWCKYNAIGKVVLDGSEDGWVATTSDTIKVPNTISSLIKRPINQDTLPYVYCSHLTTVTWNANWNNLTSFIAQATQNDDMRIRVSNPNMSLADFKTWLSTHNTEVYYVLNTPYLSLIEDNNLIEQLDNLQNTMSYKGTTNINQVNNDLPFIMSIKAMVEGSNAVVVNNIGNATSKPLIELEGSGNIDIYLNGNQILQANVEDEMNIDIDTLEAYNPDTMTLLNRQVIGNYNSMTLQPGNNTIKMSGDLTTATISNYTRWL